MERLSNPPARVLLHDEPPLSAAEPPPRHAAAPTLLAALLAAETAEQRRRTVAAMLRTIDFDWLAYGQLASFAGQLRPVSLCIAHADAQWARRYCTEAYYEVDPRLHDALQSSLPCSWTLDGLQQRSRGAPAQSPVRRFVSDLADTGMRSGAMLVLPGADRHERHVVSLLSRSAGHDWADGALLGQLLTLGLCLHEFYTRYSGLPPAPGPAVTLTPVQREILDQVARGASDKQIAYDLQLSSHAVDYHMRQLRRRFAVRNRVQLTQAAQVGAERVAAPALP
jgi:DNA-binding CsgD family transcriptional regulator